MALNFSTRRLVQAFEAKASPGVGTIAFTASVDILENEFIQYAGFSFTGDKKEKALGAMVESITFSSGEIGELTGHTLMIRNALHGFRGTYDMSHNRTHICLKHCQFVNGSDVKPGKFTVTMRVKQYSSQELKEMFSAKTNADLFDAPELFVATRQWSGVNNLCDGITHAQMTPIFKHAVTVPFVDMKDTKTIVIPLSDYLSQHRTPSSNDRILQLWFTYDVQNIQTTSSVYDKLELHYTSVTTDGKVTKDVMHTYSSPVQLQVIDKEMWNLFSPNANARSVQEKYQTITLCDTRASDVDACELHFHLHEQFYKDYENWVMEDKTKIKEIKDAVINIQFGFLWETYPSKA